MKEIISYGRFHCTELTPHKNRGMEITYIERGVMEWMVEGVPEKVEPGSVYFTLPWQVHGSLTPKEPDNTIWHVLFHLKEDYPTPRSAFEFHKALGFNKTEALILSSAFASSACHCFRATPTMRGLVPSLIRELQSTHELRDAHAQTLLRTILIEFKRIITGEAVDTETHSWSEKRVHQLLTDLSSTCDQKWTLAQMANACGLQRTRLNDIVRRLTGGTPMEYLGRLRTERAKNLLRETDMKIIDIALECGFGSSQYFANTFRHATRMTPSAYRAHCALLSREDLRKWQEVGFRTEREERLRVQNFTDE
ncbi:MAG: AraC family transcriptional regulator [Verrucomicrobia bacterium]|jgi:AraC-like DNA-binding protein|nr:AraC family transcriptional regulator [Verrucomicrobiota bacterium]